jgi:hypothetical protein
MAGDLSDQELGRRLSASRGYVRESLSQFAERIDVDRHDLGKWETGDFGSPDRHRTTARKRQDAVDRVRDASGLPAEFFSIDLQKLPLMTEAWRQAQRLPDPKDLEQILDEAGASPPPE